MTNFKKFMLAICLVAVILVVAIIVARTQQPPTITKTAEVTMTINPPPDFSLETSITHIETFPNRVVSFAASVTSINNFAGEVVFSVSGLPPDTTASIFPGLTLTLSADETKGIQIDIDIPSNQALVGDYTIVVTATSTDYN